MDEQNLIYALAVLLLGISGFTMSRLFRAVDNLTLEIRSTATTIFEKIDVNKDLINKDISLIRDKHAEHFQEIVTALASILNSENK